MKKLPQRALRATLRIISSRDAVEFSSSLKFANPKKSKPGFSENPIIFNKYQSV